MNKKSRIEIRIDYESGREIRRLSKEAGLSISEYVRIKTLGGRMKKVKLEQWLELVEENIENDEVEEITEKLEQEYEGWVYENIHKMDKAVLEELKDYTNKDIERATDYYLPQVQTLSNWYGVRKHYGVTIGKICIPNDKKVYGYETPLRDIVETRRAITGRGVKFL